jgi:hypothetical protein
LFPCSCYPVEQEPEWKEAGATIDGLVEQQLEAFYQNQTVIVGGVVDDDGRQ